MECNPINSLNLPIKYTLNSIAGVYFCINLINEKIYVGSAGINNMYRRYTGHLLNSKGGRILVNRAVKKYGLNNFAFIVVETIPDGKNVTELLKLEQKYINTLNPEYNIAKIAGSLLNTKWSMERYATKLKLRASAQLKKHLENLRLKSLNKKVSLETRALIREKALNRKLKRLKKKCL